MEYLVYEPEIVTLRGFLHGGNCLDHSCAEGLYVRMLSLESAMMMRLSEIIVNSFDMDIYNKI